MQKIGIIGGGFVGTMIAVNLINRSQGGFEIFIFNEIKSLNTGIAYSPYSKNHLLNVIAAKMSAFSDHPHHFIDWVMSKSEYVYQDINIVKNAFLPRSVYGKYLIDIWKDAVDMAKSKNIQLHILDTIVDDIEWIDSKIHILCKNQNSYCVDQCALAIGNSIPRNLEIKNMNFYESGKYFQNPWKINSVQNTKNERDILIIGNGLTMIDTVIGLIEQGFKGNMYSISPNGYNILPHRHNGVQYLKLIDELQDDMDLKQLTNLVSKHIKAVRKIGVSAEPVIDSLRPYTQKIWRRFSDVEKRVFMSRLRHLWGVARHRIPLQIHDRIQQMRIENKLHIYAAKIINIEEQDLRIKLNFLNKKTNRQEELIVDRIINCTGPETDISKLKDGLLKRILDKGLISQDNLRLGINVNLETFEIINSEGTIVPKVYTIGSSLKGMLWESTAIGELRVQSEQLASNILNILSLRASHYP